MAGLKRSLKTCVKSKSMQPFWLGSLCIAFLLYHVIFDVSKNMVHFKDSKITINVENYDLGKNPETRRDVALLLAQVKAGEKPPFVLSEDVADPQTTLDMKENNWDLRTLYPKLYHYRNLANLPAFSQISCRDDFMSYIPNVIHYIWFGKLKMNFLQYLSMRSAAAVQRPTLVILHTDSGEPEGKYWKSLKLEIPCLQVRYIKKPIKIFGQHGLNDFQQQSHIARLQVLYEEGGIYANMNVIFIRPFDDLMGETLVLGKEEEQYYSNSVILAARGAPFLTMWFTAYNRRLVDWSTYSIYIPWRLLKENPSMPVHVEEFTMMRPNFNEDEWITEKNWVLDENYCVHLYTNRDRIKKVTTLSPLEMINMDNTAGQLTRIALFGKPYFENDESRFRAAVHSKVSCSSKSSTNNGYIPNILHYVLQDENFTYKHYLSVRSAVRHLNPSAIYMHMMQTKEPESFYWIRTALETGCITILLPVQGEEIRSDATKSEINSRKTTLVQRAMQEYGGVYLSFDVIVTTEFTDLMQNHVVMGMTTAYLGNLDVVMSVKKSAFLQEWFSWDKTDLVAVKQRIEGYIEDNPEQFIEIVDKITITSPYGGWRDLSFDYRDVHCFSVSERDTKVKFDEGSMYDVLLSNTITGEIARIGHFGKPDKLDLET